MGLEALIFLGIDIDTYIGLLRLGLDLDQIKVPEIPYDLIESRLREQSGLQKDGQK